MGNDEPVSLTLILGKILERLIKDSIKKELDGNNYCQSTWDLWKIDPIIDLFLPSETVNEIKRVVLM